jgi:hypothetical protein
VRIVDESLTEGQRRAVSSGMLIVDAAAVRMLNLLENRSSPPAMNVLEGEISEREKEYIRARLKELESLLVQFVQKYQLRPFKRNVRRILAADASQVWVTLEDCRPGRIRGYGEMSAPSAESLETDLRQMLQIASWLRGLLSS